ncbi:hypothetical protein HK096_002801 [Nowakowskiella sp. JEL0078]|nr:hypothetical protein HK096_002801 [Nowakowskiella sp. JEL0078]
MEEGETSPLVPKYSDSESQSIWKKPNPFILSPVLLLYVLSVGLIAAPTEQLVMRLVCKDLKFPNGTIAEFGEIDGLPKFDECRANPDVQAETSYWLMTLTLSLTVPALFSVLIWGSISDRIGRVPMLRLAAFGSLVTVLTHIAVAMKPSLTLYTSIIAYAFQGIIGGSSGFLMGSFAYLSDSTSKDFRTIVFSIFEAFLFGGVMFAPFLGGVLDKVTGLLLVPFYASACGLILVQVYLWNLPESLVKPTNEHGELTAKNILLSTVGRIRIAIDTFTARKHRNIQRLLVIFFVATLCFASLQVTYILYTALQFSWQSYENGNFFLVLSLARTLYMTIILPYLLRPDDDDSIYSASASVTETRRIKKQLNVITTGFFVYFIGFVAYVFAKKEWMFYSVGVVEAFGVIAVPTIRGLLSTSTPQNLQGHLFSIIALVEELAGTVSPLIFSNVYSLTVGYFPQATFLVMAIFFVVCAFLSVRISPLDLINEEEESEIEAHRIDALYEDEDEY